MFDSVTESVVSRGADPLFYEALRCGNIEAMDYICKEGCGRVDPLRVMSALNDTPLPLRSKMGAISAAVLNAQEDESDRGARAWPAACQFQPNEPAVSTAEELFQVALQLEQKKDFVEAFRLHVRAAHCGMCLCVCLHFFSFSFLCITGHSLAQTQVGFCYENGQGVARSDEEAAKWYLRAAEGGSWIAQANMGVLYEQGRGVEVNPAQAAVWYRAAATRGDAESAFALGLLLVRGAPGLPHDFAQGRLFLAQAARSGMKEAMLELRRMQPMSAPLLTSSNRENYS